MCDEKVIPGGPGMLQVLMASDGSSLVAVPYSGLVYIGRTFTVVEGSEDLVEPEPFCYYNMTTSGGTSYCPAPLPGLDFTDVYMVSKQVVNTIQNRPESRHPSMIHPIPSLPFCFLPLHPVVSHASPCSSLYMYFSA